MSNFSSEKHQQEKESLLNIIQELQEQLDLARKHHIEHEYALGARQSLSKPKIWKDEPNWDLKVK
jgi:isoleucyl-tRNA synthetase